MSDYESDFEEYGDWMYIEDTYSPADDLAEHAVNSPPPSAYRDEDDDDDPFDYFIDLDYGEEGYDDAAFYTHNVTETQPGQKRKHAPVPARRKGKKQKLGEGEGGAVKAVKTHPPVVWRAQGDRGTKVRMLDGNTEAYAIQLTGDLKCPVPVKKAEESSESKEAQVSEPISPAPDAEVVEETEEGQPGPDTDALMQALQRNLAAAGGPLAGMDPQQLMQFAMRMMNGEEAGDVAGELADDMLAQGQGDEEDDEGEAPADLLDWLSKSRTTKDGGASNADATSAAAQQESPDENTTKPITPPPSEVNLSKASKNNKTELADSEMHDTSTLDQTQPLHEVPQNAATRKRKAVAADDAAEAEPAPKKRVTRSFDAPTAASRAKSAKVVPTAKATRSGRAKRS